MCRAVSWFPPPPPSIWGGENFLDPNYLGVFSLNFFHLGGKTHCGGTDKYLGGITPWVFWDIHICHILKFFACGGLCIFYFHSVAIALP